MSGSNMFEGRREVTPEKIIRIAAEQVVADFRAVQDGMINPKLLKLSIDKLENALKVE